LWDFDNDGTVDSIGQGPHTYTYNTPGTYSVKLTVSDGIFSIAEIKINYITVNISADFACNLNVVDNNGISLSAPLLFGTAPDATDGYDPAYDQYAPPPPPSGVFDARFRINSEDFLKDFRATNTGAIEWYVLYQPSSGGAPVSLSWNPAELPPTGSFRLVDYFTGGSLVEIDMRAQTSFTDTYSFGEMKIVYSLTSTFEVSVNSGWNMLGLPLAVDNGHYLTLFPDAVPNTLYGFDQTYFLTDTLRLGKGYWLRFSAGEVVPLEGYPVTTYSIPLKQGWNMISGISCDVALSDVGDPGGIIIPNTLFGFNQVYFLADTLKRGKAYWIRAGANDTIYYTCETGMAKSSINPPYVFSELDSMSIMTVTDASGASQRLYFNALYEDPSLKFRYSLPPVPPLGVFDARFEDGYWVSGGKAAVIQLQSSNYPISVRLSNLPPGEKYLIRQLLGNEVVTQQEIGEGESIEIVNSQVKGLKLSKVSSLEIPVKFMVQQNYPNPFNPTTEIRYGIPQATIVEIVVYNMLGQRIKRLVSEEQEAGYHKVVWDGTNDSGDKVGSGIYFYRIVAGRFNKVNKMIMIK
jgi:PKD repeat protein